MLVKKISAVEFSVLSPEAIRKMSALEIKTPETYDKDGYPMESGLMDPHLGVINPGLRCKTCGQRMKECPGHFGSMELVRPVVHSEFGRKVEELLHATCQQCGRIILPDDKLKELSAAIGGSQVDLTKRIIFRAKKAKKCPHCNVEKGQILLDKPTNFFMNKERIYPTQIREWLEKIPDKDLMLFGYDTARIRPEWFVLTVMPVPPITIRPSITLETGIKSEDDLTHKLVDIIRINQRLKDNIEAGAPQLIIEDLWDLLQYHVTTYFDNNTAGVPPAKHRSGRALRTLVQRLKGKKGRFRHNLTGKRVNFAARSTISPDPFISINEIGVPKAIADELTVPEYVTEWNKKDIKDQLKDSDSIVYLVRPNGSRKKISEQTRQEAIDEVDVGFKVERKLQNGDIILFNRQPSLHRLSMIAHKARIMPGRTFRINPTVCKPYNADFDGDEMNLHVPQTEEGKTEAKQLMFCENQIISPRYGAPIIALEEDGISGCFALTMKGTKFSREDTMKMLFEIGVTELLKPDMGKEYSGKLIFSQLLPKDLTMEYESNTCAMIKKMEKCENCLKEKCKYDGYVRIENGELKSGVIDAASLGESRGKLIDTLVRNYPSKVIEQFYSRTNKLVMDLVTTKGISVGLDEYATTPSVEKVREKAIAEELEEAKELVEKLKKGTLEHIPGRTLKESFEIYMLVLGAKIKQKVEDQIMTEKIKKLFSEEKPQLNTTVMILSKSRGNPTNLTNISGFWGQAAVRGGRPKRGFKNRLISLNNRNDIGALAGGFIRSNFFEGMNAREYFYHSMGGRQGEVDTGVATKVSGYLYRRLANSLKDLAVGNDGTVRTASNNLIQFVYGEDAIFPANSLKGKAVDVEAELEKMKKEGK